MRAARSTKQWHRLEVSRCFRWSVWAVFFVCACCLRYCSFNFAFAYARASTSWELDVAFCCLPAMTIAYSQSQFWLPVDYIDQEIVGAYVQHVYLCKLPCESVAHAYVHTHTRVQVYASAQYTRFIAVRRVRSFAPANIKRVFYATHIAFRFGSAIVLGNAKKNTDKHRLKSTAAWAPTIPRRFCIQLRGVGVRSQAIQQHNRLFRNDQCPEKYGPLNGARTKTRKS